MFFPGEFLYNNFCTLSMAQREKKTSAKSKRQKERDNSDKKRLRRFLFIYTPIIVVTLGFIYALSFDPIKPASRMQIEGVILEVVASSGGVAQDSLIRSGFLMEISSP